MITGSVLYDLISCPHRVTMDSYPDPADRDEVSPFIRMLWEKGNSHEHSIVGQWGAPILDLSGFHGDEKERLTIEAMLRRKDHRRRSGGRTRPPLLHRSWVCGERYQIWCGGGRSRGDDGRSVIRQRILDYNKDDCRDTRVLLDGTRALAERRT
jgi:hypothetical protein